MLATSLRSWVRPAWSYISAWSALSRQRTPWASSSRSTCLIWRSAAAGAGPAIGSTGADRLLITSVAVTTTTKTATTARMTRARVCIRRSAILVPRYHGEAPWRSENAWLDDLGAEDVVQVHDPARTLGLVHDDQA